MKKHLKKKIEKKTNSIRYFSGELIEYWKQMTFADGTVGKCHYTCGG